MSAAIWFHDHGVPVFPLKPRSKEPACRSWDDFTCTREQAARFCNYGVRLGGCHSGWLGVVDTDEPENEAWVAAHLIDTPFKVRTARGLHRYFRLDGPVPKFLHRDGHTIEFRNQGQYVVGPGSTHQSGAIYGASDWSWHWEDLPYFPSAEFVFDDGSCGRMSSAAQPGEPFEFPEEVRAGERHHQLFCLLRSFKGLGAEQAVAREAVRLANQHRCHPPLVEDGTFERWFERAWHNPDRPLDPLGHRIPLRINITTPGWI